MMNHNRASTIRVRIAHMETIIRRITYIVSYCISSVEITGSVPRGTVALYKVFVLHTTKRNLVIVAL